MAKSERELLREWASIVEADKTDPTLDPLNVGGREGSPMQIDIGLLEQYKVGRRGGDDYRGAEMGPSGGFGGFAGGGRGVTPTGPGTASSIPAPRIEPILNKPSKPRIQMKPGETQDQAMARVRRELQAKPEAPAAKAPEAPAAKSPEAQPTRSPTRPATPRGEKPQLTKQDYIDIERAKKPSAIEWWREKPVRRTLGPITGAAAGAGLIGSLAKNIIGKKPEEDWADVAGAVAGDVADVSTAVVTGATKKAGERVGKAEREAGVTPEPEDFFARDRQNMPPAPTKDYRIPPEGKQGLDEMTVYVKHPISDKLYQVKVNRENLVRKTAANTVYENYQSGVNSNANWQYKFWSNTPISKIVKGLK